jgi:hypothetical protein
MSPYFIRAGEEQQVRGGETYLDTLQRICAQDERGGMIEASLSADDRLVYLYLAGQQVVIYRLTSTQATSCDVGEARSPIFTNTPVRYLKLSDEATRSVWQALAWYPPVRGAHLEGQARGACLDALRVERANVRLYAYGPGLLEPALAGAAWPLVSSPT